MRWHFRKLAPAVGAALSSVALAAPAATAGVAAPLWTVGPSSRGELDVADDTTYKLTVDTTTPGCSGLAAPGDNWKYSTSYTLVTPAGGTGVPTIVYSP
ncbi:hypothetical protein [Streptomyces sp. NPDC053728]|uniref:hypothetical protein n=1 Tax=unclassified Streptomyces TaxID=2593676 RepID=UPI0034361E6C